MSTTLLKKPVAENPFKKSSSEKALLKVAKRNHNKYKAYLDPSFTKKSRQKCLVTNDIRKMSELLKLDLAIGGNA